MGQAEFRLGILYTTIALVQPGEYLNDWDDVHFQQGFSWRPQSVSFGTLTDKPECKVIVRTCEYAEVNPTAIRVIVIPFIVKSGGIEICSIADSQAVNLLEGTYEVVFNAIPSDESQLDTYEFVFVKSQSPTARIIRADAELTPPEVLCMDARPAI